MKTSPLKIVFAIALIGSFWLGGGLEGYAQESANTDEASENAPGENVPPLQDLPPIETLTGDPQIEEMVRRALRVEPDFLTIQIPSLFLTSGEQNLLADARRGLVARPATESEIARSEKELEMQIRPPKGPDEIFLGGIVYVSSGDWTVWLNGQKITPKRLPPEILDIRVQKDHVKLKWFDAHENKVYPVKLRANQRFHIESRMFLPGTAPKTQP